MQFGRPDRQKPSEVVDVAKWATSTDVDIHPVGSKPKSVVICPENAPFAFLIPKHRYIFKRALDWRAQQVWSEVIAYEYSKLCGVDAPPCFVAIDSRTDQPGVLMEFFHGYPDQDSTTRLIHGTDILQRTFKEYDLVSGRPHSARANIALTRALGIARGAEWWAKTFAFDALIGNVDRHAQNWGLLFDNERRYRMAPAFDNGTSLAYEIDENGLSQFTNPQVLARYLEKGRHHCTWAQAGGQKGETFDQLCALLVKSEAPLKAIVLRLIPPDEAPLRDLVQQCTAFDIPTRFSPARAGFVESLIRARSHLLLKAIGL
jgi:hypothetical protein